MKTLYIFFLFILVAIGNVAKAQITNTAGINTTNPNTSSVLHIVGENKPVMFPKVDDPTAFDGNTKLKAGTFFDNRSDQKCIEYMYEDGTNSGCILTTADVATSEINEVENSTAITISSSSYTDLLTPISFTANQAPRKLFVSADLMRQVTVAATAGCASMNLRIVLTNTTDGTSQILYEDLAYIVPRKPNIVDIYPISSKLVFGYLQKYKAYTVSFQYQKNFTCTPSVDTVLSSSLTAVAY